MKVTGKSGTEYVGRTIKKEKVPKMKGDKYKSKKLKVNGQSLDAKFDPNRNSGLYVNLDGKDIYFVDRKILDESSVTVTEREKKEPKPKAEKKTSAKSSKATGNKGSKKGGKPVASNGEVLEPIEGA